jgi:hypothetical protein
VLVPGGHLEGCALVEREGRNHGVVADAVKLLALLRVRGMDCDAPDSKQVLVPGRRLPRQAKTSETQIPCADVHRFLPGRRTRIGMLPGRLRSLRFLKNIMRSAMAMSHSGTPMIARIAQITLPILPLPGLPEHT